MDKNQRPIICCLQETHFISKNIHRLKEKGLIKIFLQMENYREQEWPYLNRQKRL